MVYLVADKICKKFNVGFQKRQTSLGRVVSFISGIEQKKVLTVLNGVSIKVQSGEIVGLIGKNGCGKSTLLRILANIYFSNCGIIKSQGKIVSLIGLGNGFFSRLTMKENIFIVGSLFGLTHKEIEFKFNDIVAFSELGAFVETKLYQFSAGMLQRLAFAIAINSNPDILLLDEVFEVGDESFKKKSVDEIKRLVKGGACVIWVSHDLDMIEKHCNRVVWLKDGKVFKEGNPKKIVEEYMKDDTKYFK